MAQVNEGISPRLEQNAWFNQNIKPKVTRAVYIDAEDGFHYQIVRTEDVERGRISLLVLKVTATGFVKSMMTMSPALAKAIAEHLAKLAE